MPQISIRRARVLRAVGLAAMLALLTAGSALADAGGQGTVTTTQQFRNIALFPPQPMGALDAGQRHPVDVYGRTPT